MLTVGLYGKPFSGFATTGETVHRCAATWGG
jgi:hypothetical protein